MDEIKVGDKVLIDYYGTFKFNGIVTSIDGNGVKGEITPPISKFRVPKYAVFPIKEKDDNADV